MKKKPDADWFAPFVAPPLTARRALVDRTPGECDWRDHLPAVDPGELAALNRTGSNRVNNFLVMAFREIDKGRAGQTARRRADYREEGWRMLRDEATKLRARTSRPTRRADIRRDPIWSGRPEALARRLGRNPLFPQKKPRRLGREHWFNALVWLSMAYRLDTGRKPTLTSKDRQPTSKDSQPRPAANSFDAYLETFCKLSCLPPSSMRHLFRNHRRTFQTDHLA